MSGRHHLDKLRCDLIALPPLSEPNWSEMEAWIVKARAVFRRHFPEHLEDLEKATRRPSWSYPIVIASGGSRYDFFDGSRMDRYDDDAGESASCSAENALLAEAVRKRALALVDTLLDVTAPNEKPASGIEPKSNIQVFISHAAADAAIAGELVDLINNSMIVPGDGLIRCTSVEGYSLPVGINTSTALRDDIASCRAFIALLTSRSMESSFVLMELGAAWALQKTALMCLAPWFPFQRLPAIFSQIQAVQWGTSPQMASFISAISDATEFELRNQTRVTKAMDKFMKSVPMTPPAGMTE